MLIAAKFRGGLHFIGEWHTHPEPHPTPSKLDSNSARDSFRKSKHQLNLFVSIVVGNAQDVLELWVGVHGGTNVSRVRELSVNENDH